MKIKNVIENEISYTLRGAIFQTYLILGPGLLESAYKEVLKYEIEKLGLDVQAEVGVPLIHEKIKLNVGYRMDLLVEKKVLIEIKSIETPTQVHHKQVITYLKLSGLKLGILVNFNTDNIQKAIFRKVNGL